jgi:DNA polymerase III epsilon subunit-like protein
MKPCYEVEAVILDTETTGIRPPVEPIQVSYIALPALDQLSATELLERDFFIFSKRFKPNKPIEAGAQAIHGIKLQDVIREPVFTLDQLGLPDKPIHMIAHNASFDHRALGKPENLNPLCTIKLAKKYYPGLESYKLGSVISYLYSKNTSASLDKLKAHDALDDARFVLLILAHILASFPTPPTYADL